jgi:hypothetical protein
MTRNAGGDPSFEYHVRPCPGCEFVLEVQGWLVGKNRSRGAWVLSLRRFYFAAIAISR